MNENQINNNSNGANTANNANIESKKPFYTKWWMWAILILILILLSIFGGERKETKTPENNINIEEAAPQKPSQALKIGDTVKAGDMACKVLEANNSKTIGNNEISVKETENNYLVVKLIVKNASEKPLDINENMFTLKDSSGNAYQADASSDLYVNSPEKGFLKQEISPNNIKAGCIVFETPASNADIAYDLEINNGNSKAKINLSK